MLYCVLMTILGIVLSVSNANGWFIVPDFCVYICFGVAVLLLIISIINWLTAKHQFDKMSRRF